MKCLRCETNDPRWDQFVKASPEGTFFHLLAWRDLIAKTFDYQPFYLYAEEGQEIAGVLPLFMVKSLLFGRSLVTVPLGVYGGIVARNQAAHSLLLTTAENLAAQLKVRYMEFRGNPYRNGKNALVSDHPGGHLVSKDLYVTFMQEIDSDPEQNFSRIPRKQRRMIRQGQKFGLRSVMDDSRLRDFYKVYAESVRNLGTPVYGFRYFQELKTTFGDQCRLLLVEHQERPVAGVLSFLYKDQILPYYGGSIPSDRNLAPNDFMYWDLMSFGATHGYRIFDFGRSKRDSGSYNFKRHWGFQPRPLPYLYYYHVDGLRLPDTSSRNPRLQWAVRLWRHIPLRLTMAVGPYVVRHIP